MDIIVLYINMLSFCLAYGILHEDNTCFIVTIKDTHIDKICNSQFIEKLSDS